LFGEALPAQDPRTWAGPAARSAVAERRRSPAEALPAARRPRKRWKAGKLQPKRGQARTWKFCSHFKIVARARHAQCSICNKCIRPFDLVERCASHQTIFHHRCTIDPSPPLSVLHCLNTCARHIVQFRQPRQLVGPDGRSDLRGCGGDDESMNVTEEENLFQSSYEESEDLANSVADSAGESPPADLCVHCSCRSPSDCRHAQAERDAADACPETQAYLDQRWSEERRADELAQDEDEIPPTPPMTAMQRDDR
jgi:hypothetical protein